MEHSIRKRCHVNTNYDVDTFVGIRCTDGDISVNFPLGFHVSEGEKELRRDILLLLTTLSLIVEKEDSTIMKVTQNFDSNGFPIQAYLYVISDYYNRGYYKEREIQYQINNRGKINWNKTIKTQRPFIQGAEAYYTRFVTRKNPVNENELITLIHEYCVYESFCKMGWLFTPALPARPRIKLNKKMFKAVIMNKYIETNNDKNKTLFKNMLAIIENLQDSDSPLNYQYGIAPFDHAWETMIDKVFGIVGKEAYYPNTTWSLGTMDSDNADLRPDSIMLWNGNVYVLDAKNYKFGRTKKASDLPKSTDINKQITYGEYIAETEKFKKIHGESFKTFNAFLMPYDADAWGQEKRFHRIGEATGNWKSGNKIYERVQGILVDVKYLMGLLSRPKENVIEELAKCIEECLE